MDGDAGREAYQHRGDNVRTFTGKRTIVAYMGVYDGSFLAIIPRAE